MERRAQARPARYRPHRLVQPFHLAGGGRRVRGGQQVPDPVLGADPVEAHRPGSEPEPRGEDLAVEFLTGVKLCWGS
jgi:hypothetical protein